MPMEDNLTGVSPHKPVMRHIAEIDFPAFYAEVFPALNSARAFYAELDALPPKENRAKIVFHQTARMIWLADRIDEVARGRPAFQVLFYLIAAELVAKLTFGFKGEGQSRKFVRRFFAEICDDDIRKKLSGSFGRLPYGSVTSDQVVDLLYAIRCDVVHEGLYYTFHLQDEGDEVAQVVHADDVSYTTTLTVQDLRRMILRGAVSASKRLLKEAQGSKTVASSQP